MANGKYMLDANKKKRATSSDYALSVPNYI